MEQKRKIGCGDLRNRGAANDEEDRISELPEALLLHILSSLPTETAIATSVLSKRWKSIWKMMPKLKFGSKYHNHNTFPENVCTSLLLHRAPVLKSLHLGLSYECYASDLGLWVGIAFARNVRKLVLKFYFVEEDEEEEVVEVEGTPVKFPSVLCRCNNTLESLKLEGSIHLDLPSPVCFKSLKKLHLCRVKFENEESLNNILNGCPRLEDLVLHRQRFMDVKTLTIAVPSLQRLTLEHDAYAGGFGGYVIKSPSLKYLSITWFSGLEFFLIENVPELVEAKLSEVCNIDNENILESLVSAKSLSLSLSPLKIKNPTGKIFYQLLSLELHTVDKAWWNLLPVMLSSSPKLQILKLTDPYRHCAKPHQVGKWTQPKNVPECLLFHLETFVWTRYEWQREDEKEVATYILNNARCLKKAAFSIKRIRSKKLGEWEREVFSHLSAEIRASKSCHLVVETCKFMKSQPRYFG